MVRSGTLLLLLFSVFFSSFSQAEVTDIEATVDKNPVIANESFVLTVTFNDDVSNAAFKPQQLLSDFIVGRTSVSRQTSIRNGELSKLTRFTTVLIGKQAGSYTIPAIQMDNAQSQPITIEVLAAGSDTSERSERLAFIETTVDTRQVFLQQPLTYIVRLYLAADLNKGNLVPPQIDNADIRQIGQDQESSKMLNGRRYKVYQRTFQITPNKSGTLSIEGARFDGEVYTEGQRSIFSSFSNTQPVSAIGETIDLSVKPIPGNWSGDWLPSELVTISQTLESEPETIDVGEPLTVTYQLTAVGVKPEQLPAIRPNFPDSVRVYPDNEETDQFVRNGVPIAQKTKSFAIVANDPGQLTLPAVEIPWFNTKRQQRDMATTEPLTLTVEGVANPLSQPSTEPAETEQNKATPSAADEQAAPTEKPDSGSAISQVTKQPLVWLLLTLLVLSVLANLAFLWRRKHRTAQAKQQQSPSSAPLTHSRQWRNFQKACADNQARQADQFLRRWAQQRYAKPLLSITDLARWLAVDNDVDQQLKQQLNELQQSLFSATKPRWNGGKALYQSLRNALDKANKNERKNSLPSLYRN